MSDRIDFNSVRKVVKKILKMELSKYPEDSYVFEALIDREDCYRASIEWDNCMGEILVEMPVFAPYRFVNITIMPYEADDYTPLFYWNDSADDSIDIIEKKIAEGIEVAQRY